MIAETVSHNVIPLSYQHAMNTDPERWMAAMKTEMETLKVKHTWDLVKPPPNVNIMGSKWIYDIKWRSLQSPTLSGQTPDQTFAENDGITYWTKKKNSPIFQQTFRWTVQRSLDKISGIS